MKVERIIPLPLTNKQAAEYAAAAAHQALNVKAVKVKNLGGGSFGRAFAVKTEDGSEFVVKLLRAPDMMEKEAHDLRLLSKYCSLPLPQVLFTRLADRKIPVDCYGMEKMSGKNAFFDFKMLFMGKRRRAAFAETVIDALHGIHLCKNPLFGDTLNPDCRTWTEFYKPFAAAVMNEAEKLYSSGELKKKIITVMRAAWQKFDVIFKDEIKEACLIHGDLNIANIMVDKNHRPTGFIDPLNSMYADREYDLFQFDNLTGKRFGLRKAYTDKYGASENCGVKLAFYGLWNEVFCFIKAGVMVGFIMNPLIKNMRKRLAEL